MQIKPLLSPRNLAVLASFAVIGIGAGGYLLVDRGSDGYSCEGLLLSKAEATAYLKDRAPSEVIDSSLTCTPTWIRTPEAEGESAAAEEEEQEAEGEATDRPDDAVRFRNLSLRDEHGVVPFDGLVRASEHVAEMTAAAAGDTTLQISKTTWRWLGPGNVGGRTRAVVIHPTNPSIMWLGSVGGGVWKTTNGGTTWAPLSDFIANLAISSLVIGPANPNILFAGTGEGFFNGDALRGAGIFKTTNGGTNWAQLASTNNVNFQYVNRVAISKDGDRLLAATRTGIFRSTNGGGSWVPSLSPAEEVLDVVFSPGTNLNAVLGGRLGKAWWSTNGGQSWTPATGITPVSDSNNFLGRVELAYSKSNPLIVYASVDTSSGSSGALYKSTNGGHSYTLMNNTTGYLSSDGFFPASQGWYDNVVWVDPTNPNRIVVGGIDLWRSTNSGTALTKISDWREWYNNRSAHADQHTIVNHPAYNGTTNKTVFFGNDGGVYKNANVLTATTTTGWVELNNNLGITQFYGAAGNPTTGDVIAGAQDNGTQFYKIATGPQGWHLSNGGDGGFVAADRTNPNYVYGEYVYLTIARSSNRGQSSQNIYSSLGDANSCAYFIAPFIIDPNNANRLWAGGCRLWTTANAKVAGQPSWTVASTQLAAGAGISAIAVLKGNSNIVWVGYGDGSVFRTANALAATPTWTKVDDNSPGLPARFLTRITLKDANTAYVTFGGFSPDNVWRTGDNGAHWVDRTGSGATGLPDAPVRSLVIHPAHPTWIYAGTEVGVFYSTDEGVHWTVSPRPGPANVSVDELNFLNTALIAGTHGRGVFKSETEACLALTKNVSPAGDGTITATPAANCVTSATTYSHLTSVTLKATPKAGFHFVHWTGASTSTNATIKISMTAAQTVTAVFAAGAEAEVPEAAAEPTSTVN